MYNSTMDKLYNSTNFDFGEMDNFPVDRSVPVNDNLLNLLDNKVSSLKQESIEQLNTLSKLGISKPKNYVTFDEDVLEPKVTTHYMALQDDRVQAIKHVQTLQKPEYMTLEELRQEIAENAKRIQEYENDYYTGNSNYSSGMYRSSKGKRPAIYREGYNTDTPLDDNDHTFINKYEDYLSKKGGVTTITGKLGYEEEWNTTRITSLNANGIVNRTDGLPGYLDQDDY